MTDESHNGIVESSELEKDLPSHPDGPVNHGEEEFDSRYVATYSSFLMFDYFF